MATAEKQVIENKSLYEIWLADSGSGKTFFEEIICAQDKNKAKASNELSQRSYHGSHSKNEAPSLCSTFEHAEESFAKHVALKEKTNIGSSVETTKDTKAELKNLEESTLTNYQKALDLAKKKAVGTIGEIVIQQQTIDRLAHQLGLVSADKSVQHLVLAEVKKQGDNEANPDRQRLYQQLVKALEKQEQATVNSLAPSIIEFRRAQFLSHIGQTNAAKAAMRRAEELSPEAQYYREFQQASKEINLSLQQKMDLVFAADRRNQNPYYVLEQARTAKTTKEQQDLFEQAIQLAKNTNVAKLLAEVASEKKKPAANLELLKAKEEGVRAFKNVYETVSVSYANFLLEQKNYAYAAKLLLEIAKKPEVARNIKDGNGNNVFAAMLETALSGGVSPMQAAKQSEDYRNQFVQHLQKAYDLTGKKRAVQAETKFKEAQQSAQKALAAAEKIDEQTILALHKTVCDQLKSQKTAQEIKHLTDLKNTYESLLHVKGQALLSCAFASANMRQNNEGNKFLDQIIAGDTKLGNSGIPTFLSSSANQKAFADLKEALRERGYFQRACEWLKGNAGTLVAIGVGFAVGTALIWTGPGGVAAGIAAGIAAGAVLGGGAGVAVDYALGKEDALSWKNVQHKALLGATSALGGHLGAAAKIASGGAYTAMGSKAALVSRFAFMQALPKILQAPVAASIGAGAASIPYRAWQVRQDYVLGAYDNTKEAGKAYGAAVFNDATVAATVAAPLKLALLFSVTRHSMKELVFEDIENKKEDYLRLGVNVGLGLANDLGLKTLAYTPGIWLRNSLINPNWQPSPAFELFCATQLAPHISESTIRETRFKAQPQSK